MNLFAHAPRCLCALLCCWLLAPLLAHSATNSALSLREAISATLKHHPQLAAFEFRRQIAQAEHYSAGLKPALALEANAENIAGSGPYAGTAQGEFTLALSSVIELGGKSAARQGVTGQQQEFINAQQAVAQLDLLAEVTRRFIAAVQAQQQVRLQQASLEISKETTHSIKQRVDTGGGADMELARAKANQARIAIGLRQAELNFSAAKVNLAAMWGQTQADFSQLQGDLFNLGATVPLDELMQQLANNADLAVLASQSRLHQAQLRLAQSLQKNDIEWSAGVRRLQASQDSALVLGASIPLSSAKRANGEITAAKARVQEAEIERSSSLLNLRAQLFGLFQARLGAIYEVEKLRDEVIPQLKNAVNGTRAAYDTGRLSYLELTSAQAELIAAQAALIDAAALAQTLRAEIERLCSANSFQLAGNTPAKNSLPQNSLLSEPAL